MHTKPLIHYMLKTMILFVDPLMATYLEMKFIFVLARNVLLYLFILFAFLLLSLVTIGHLKQLIVLLTMEEHFIRNTAHVLRRKIDFYFWFARQIRHTCRHCQCKSCSWSPDIRDICRVMMLLVSNCLRVSFRL